MLRLSGPTAVAFLTCLASLGPDADAGELGGRITDRESGAPVEGALVHVSGAEGFEKVVTTDRDGRYRIDLGAGTYEVLILYGMSQARGRISLGADDVLVLDDQVATALGEVIVVEEPRRRPVWRRPAVLPKAKNYSRVKAPPYSDGAILSDAWTRAWLLLDVDKTGVVQRMKFLKRPGYDLEPIAIAEAFKLRFEPARDARGRPTATPVIWRIEWPSHGWLIARIGTATRMPQSLAAHVPCTGSGPLNLDSVHPTYRDCSEPELSKAASETWIVRREGRGPRGED